MVELLLLPALIFVVALPYPSVGHAGASGDLAAVALCGVAPPSMKPAALALNLLVAAIAPSGFYRAGRFSSSRFWPSTAASVPLAFIGEMVTLPGDVCKPIVGLVLLLAAHRRFWTRREDREPVSPRAVPLTSALGSGAGIGLLSGLTASAAST